MNQDQRLQQLASTLREKAYQFDTNKERSKEQIKSNVKELRDQIDTIEADLLRKIDLIFRDNPFATVLGDVEGHNSCTFVDYNKLESVSREPVPPVTGPSQEDFFEAQITILELKNFERKTKAIPLRMIGRALSFDTIELSWSSVPSAMAYQVEARKPSNTEFSKVYEGNSLSYTVTGLEPGTKYLLHLQSIFGDGSVSEWSREIEVITQEAPVPCNITANALSCDTVNVTWNPVPAEGIISYRVWVEENTTNGPRTCVVDCGQSTCYKPSGLQADTTYNFSVQAGRGNAWGKWSRTVAVDTQESDELPWDCVWKECSNDADKGRKHLLDEENPRIATKINGSGYWCTIIGNTSLPPNKVTLWNIKVLKSENNDGKYIYIGVAPSDINQSKEDNYKKCGWYFCCYDSSLWSGPLHNYRGKKYGPGKEKGEYIHTGDVVGTVIDLTKGKLLFVVNGVSLGVAFDGIPLDKPLVPCVILGLKGDSIELII